MPKLSRLKTTVKILALMALGALVSLATGALISFAPDHSVDGVQAGILSTGTLLVLVYFVLVRVRDRRNRPAWVFRLHSVLGIATGVLLSVIFLTGVLLLYRPEIDAALNPWLQVDEGGQTASVDDLLDAAAHHVDLAATKRLDIVWPASPNHAMRIGANGPEGAEVVYVNPYSAEIIDRSLRWKTDLIRRLHVQFNLGTFGHWTAGAVALIAVWLSIGGLTMGRNVFRDWYRVRWRRGLQTLLSDLHKRIGLWFLPFLALNAFAGMLAALFGVFSIGPVEARFGGDYGDFYAAVGSPQSVERIGPAARPTLDRYVDRTLKIMPGAKIRRLTVTEFGDENAIVTIRANKPGALSPDAAGLVLSFRAQTGELLFHEETAEAGIFRQISMALTAFHFAEYGPPWVRLLHAISAMIVAVLPFIGLAIWLTRRRRQAGRKQ